MCTDIEMKKEVNNKIKSFEKISWKSEEELLFKEKLVQDIHCVLSMKKVYDEIEYGNVNNAVELLENILKCA